VPTTRREILAAFSSRGRRQQRAPFHPIAPPAFQTNPLPEDCLPPADAAPDPARTGGKVPPPGGRCAPAAPSAPGGFRGGELHPALEATRRGDLDGLARLLEASRKVLLATVGPRLRGGWCEDWTEDVVQEALVDIVRAHGDCRASSEREVVAWVRSIGRRQVAELFVKEAGRRGSSLDAVGDVAAVEACAPSPRIARALESVRAVVCTLGREHHRLLWSRVVASHTWQEVGEELGIPPTAAKRRWQRVLARLRATGPP
jgi:DNA-directed RNA polymerase specialized sigma24 family protein